MPKMQPGSGGPYSDQRHLRWEIGQLKNDLEAKPMGSRERIRVQAGLVGLQTKLKKINAEIREMKKSRAKSAV